MLKSSTPPANTPRTALSRSPAENYSSTVPHFGGSYIVGLGAVPEATSVGRTVSTASWASSGAVPPRPTMMNRRLPSATTAAAPWSSPNYGMGRFLLHEKRTGHDHRHSTKVKPGSRTAYPGGRQRKAIRAMPTDRQAAARSSAQQPSREDERKARTAFNPVRQAATDRGAVSTEQTIGKLSQSREMRDAILEVSQENSWDPRDIATVIVLRNSRDVLPLATRPRTQWASTGD